nr:hypothetical protein [Tanacetum cinerariifolium]
MRTRNSYYPNNSSVTIPRRQNKRRASNVVEPELRTIVEIAPVADNRTTEELLQAPTEGTLEFYNESNKECIETLKKKLETLKQENEGVDGKLAGLLTASKDLDNLIESQRSDKNKEGLGYTTVPPPPAQLYLSPKKDLSWIGLPECVNDTVTDYSRPSPTVESTSEDDQNRNPFVSETVASPITPKPFIKFVKPKNSQSKSNTNKKETPKKPPAKYAEQYRKPNKKPNVRGNQRNWNNLKSLQLGPDFVIKKKACFNCGDFNHLAYDCRKRAHSYEKRHVHRTLAVRSPYRAPWVPTVNRNYPPVNRKFSTGSRNFPTANRKFPSASRKFPTDSTKSSTADTGRKGKAGSSQNKIDDKGYWDSSCSRQMTGNISYLSDCEPFDEGYVSFGQGGCKITGKGTIKTGKLEFENVYFVKDLKYNLFSVSQICDNKNSVLFTDSECIVLGRDFKLLDNANILLRTPRQYNMYSIDLNNIIPHRDLTCLVAKASADECMLWHRRLGDEGYFIGYSMSSKAFRVFNKRTRRVEENLHVEFLENKAIEKGSGPNWLFDIDSLTKSMNYVPADAGTISTNLSDESNGEEADISNMETTITASPTPTLRIYKDHPKIEPKKISDALQDPSWVEAINKARLVAQRHTQEEEIDYDEVFAPVARIEAIRLFLAYASFMGFTDPKFPAKVYKVEKAMYGLHQDTRAWYGTLSKYLLKNGFRRGKIDQTLFIRRQREDFILVQVYVDDIIFGSTNPQLCRDFEALMHEKFQMSAMGDILKKFEYTDVRSSNTPMDKENPWGKDGTGQDVELHLYRSMIGFDVSYCI